MLASKYDIDNEFNQLDIHCNATFTVYSSKHYDGSCSFQYSNMKLKTTENSTLTGSFDTDQFKSTANNTISNSYQLMCSPIFTPNLTHKSETRTEWTLCSAPQLEALSSNIVNHICDSNGIRTHNHLVRKRTLDHLTKLFKN